MKSTNGLRALLVIALSIHASAFAADAADADPPTPPAAAEEKPAALDTITVIGERDDGFVPERTSGASKTDTPLIEVPASISVVTREMLDTRGVNTVSEALRYTAGVNPVAYGADSRFDWIVLRGFDAYSPGFYQDGLLGRNNNSWAVWRTEPYGVERIEILRGAASVLHGQNGPGGLINVVTKQPTVETLREVKVQGGNHDRLEAAADFGGALDGSGQWLSRLTGFMRTGGTQVDEIDDDRVYVAPALTWRPSPETRVTFLSHFQEEKTATTLGFLPAEGTVLPNPNGRIPADRFIGEPDYDKFDKTQWSLGWQAEHQLNPTWTLRQNARYGGIEVDYRQLLGSGFDPDDASRRRLLRSSFGSREDATNLALDNQMQASFATGAVAHRVLMGLDVQRQTFDQRTFFGFAAAAPLDVYDPQYGQPVADVDPYLDSDFTLGQTGLYVQDQLKFATHWVAVLGGRMDWTRNREESRLTGDTTQQRDQQFSGRAGLLYLADNGLAPYFSYSESFSPALGRDADTGKEFEPETGEQFELGIKYQPRGGESFVALAAFDLRRKNFLSSDPMFVQRQTGEIRSRGLELEAIAEFGRSLDMTLAWTWQAELEATAGEDPAEFGERQPRTAEHSGSVWMDYKQATGLLAGWGIGAGLRYVGETGSDVGDAPRLDIPDYTLLDAALHYERAGWRMALNASNVEDKEYVSTCGFGTCYYGSTRSVTASARYSW